MNVFIKSARIVDPTSPFHNKIRNIIIQRGVIQKIGNGLKNSKGFQEISGSSLFVSPGWVDMFAFLGDPGFEYKEDLYTGSAAAASGGFTGVCCMPNTLPVIDSKSGVEYLIKKVKDQVVDILPIGAISLECAGKDITEIYDMKKAGAVAFSDGINSSVDAGLMLRSLLYVKPFNGVVISHPDDKSIRNDGVINEGAISASLGLKGIPSISEEVIVMRDIYLAEYTGSRIHFAYISTKGSVDLIRKAKASGVKVTCSVSPYNLMLNEQSIPDYDTNYKVIPPIKGVQDVKALIKGLKDGVIDTIASMHIPQDIESKDSEYDYAEFGMTGLETAYAVSNTALSGQLNPDQIIDKFSIKPREILNIDIPSIKEGAVANITMFENKTAWHLDEEAVRSRSRNSPFFGKELTGKVVGIINHDRLHLN